LVFSIISNVSNQEDTEDTVARGEKKENSALAIKIQALERYKFEPLTDG
jgi:hypothetical protein